MKIKGIVKYWICCLTFILGIIPVHAKAEIQSIWEKYNNLHTQQQTEPIVDTTVYQGKIIGPWSVQPEKLYFEDWPHRSETYEILSGSRAELASLIYGLALYTKDLDKSVSIQRFEKGAMGFHYSIDQVVDWANAIQDGKFGFKSPGEIVFLNGLVQDQVLKMDNDKWSSTEKVAHIIGATAGKRRGLSLNLTHERVHVLWDEDPNFREDITKKWNALALERQKEIIASFKGYDQTNIPQMIEEWGVKKFEKNPPWYSQL